MPTRFLLDGKEIDPPVDLEGLRDVEGTYTGVFDSWGFTNPKFVLLYHDRKLTGWRRHWALFADRFLGRPYPQDVLALEADPDGNVTFDFEGIGVFTYRVAD